MATEYKRAWVKGYEGEYEVDTLGNVYSLKTKRRLVPNDSKHPYYQVALCHNGVRRQKKIHRLVAEAFIPNPNNYPQVNHKDECKHNNVVDNLEWCTAYYNTHYGTGIERQRKKHIGVKHTDEEKKNSSIKMKAYWETHKHPLKRVDIECINDGEVFHSYCEVQNKYGIERHTVKKMCETGKVHHGLSFRYLSGDKMESR